MKYPKEYLEEIKLRLKVSQVVGKYVNLKKRGKEFIGLSPFSNEKTPSFTVNDEKGFYHCFSSAEHGKTKLLNYKQLEELGYNIVIYPVTTQRLAMKNVEDGLRDIYANGHQNNIIDKMQTRKRLYDLVDYEKYNSLDEKIYNFNTDGHE